MGHTDIDEKSIVIGSELKKGKVKDSVIAKCRIGKVDVEDSILVNVSDDSEDGIDLHHDSVRADIFAPTAGGNKTSLKTDVHIDGGKFWKETQKHNDFSYEDVYNNNQNADMNDLVKRTNSEHDAVAQKLGWFEGRSNGWIEGSGGEQ